MTDQQSTSLPFADTPSDIIVIGGGLTGFVMALSAAHEGAAVTLIDRASSNHNDNQIGDQTRTTTINPKSYDHLNKLGVIDGLMADKKSMTPLRHIKVSDEKTRPSPGFARSDELISWQQEKTTEANQRDPMAPDRPLAPDQPLAYVFRNADVMAVMHDLINQHANITCHNGISITDFTPKHPDYGDAAAGVYTNDGAVMAGRLVVAADGRNSPIRTAAGIKAISRNPGQTAIVADIQTSKPHQNMAWQRFIDGGPAALMPIDNDRLMSLVWTLRDDDADILMKADDQSFSQSLTEHFSQGFGALTVSGDRLTWPLRLSHVPFPIGKRLILAGDAAHAIHPLAGQGYNLAVGDAIALSAWIRQSLETGSDLGAKHGLRAYARSRSLETTAMTLATDGLNAVFSFGHPVAAAVTGMGMALLNASPFKKLALKAASGGLTRPE